MGRLGGLRWCAGLLVAASLAVPGQGRAASPSLPLVVYGTAAYPDGSPVASGTVQAYLSGQPAGEAVPVSDGSFGSVGLGGAPSLLVDGSTSGPDDTGLPVAVSVGGIPARVVVQACTDASGSPVVPAPASLTWQSGWVCQVALTLPGRLAVATVSLPPATVGAPYAASLTATGGAPPYTWSVVGGALPAGISLDPATGALGGTPTAPGTSQLTVRATDADGAAASAALTLSVGAALAVVTATLPGATAGAPYQATLAAAGGTPPYRWSVTQGSLPAGLILSPDGVLAGVPAAPGLSAFTVQTQDSATPSAGTASASLLLLVAPVGVAGTATADVASPPPAGQPATLAVTEGGRTTTAAAVVGFQGLIGLADYASDPVAGGPPPGVVFSAGSFFDVAVVDGQGLAAPGASLVVSRCAGVAPDDVLTWYDGRAWVPVSPTATFGSPQPGCLSATLTATSSPSLAELVGTPFAVAEPVATGGLPTGGGATSSAPPPGAPTVFGVSPAAGSAVGGTQVAITGTGFVGPVSVRFGSTPAVRVTVVSPTEVLATAPAGTGTVDVTVTAAGGSSAAAPHDRFTYTPPPPLPTPRTFPDVPRGFWARGAIETLAARGIVVGFPDGTFRPGAPVTRAEFVKMLVLTLGLHPGGSTAFADVPASAWYAPYVAAALHAGILEGLTPTTFGPGAHLTREEMAVLIARALRLRQTTALRFRDAAEIAPWARLGIEETVAAGYVDGFPDGTFRPLDTATRAQAAKVLALVLAQAPSSGSGG